MKRDVADGRRLRATGGAIALLFGSLVLLGGSSSPLLAATGDLDLTFGPPNGYVNVNVAGTEQPGAAAIDAHDRVVAVGSTFGAGPTTDLTVIRLLANGTLDPTFGIGGKVVIDRGASEDLYAVVLLDDGSMIAAGSTFTAGQRDTLIVKLDSSGDVDPSFGVAGFAQLNLSSTDSPWDVEVQQDGSIVLGGDDFLARLTPSGSLDPSFGSNGVVTGMTFRYVSGIEIAPDDSILVGGQTADDEFMVRRFTASGAVDSSFGVAGAVRTALSRPATAYSFALQGDGSAIVGGSYSTSPFNIDLALWRVTAAGVEDSGFGNAGLVLVDFRVGDFAEAIEMQPDGRIVVGASFVGSGTSTSDVGVVRLLTDGTRDLSFGNAGIAVANPGQLEFPASIALQSTGRIVVMSQSTADPGRTGADFQMAAFQPGDVCVAGSEAIIGWWRGEDSTAAAIGPDLTGTTGYTPATVGRGFALGGIDSLSAGSLEGGTGAVTVEAWVKLTASDGLTQTLISKWDFPSTDDSARSFALQLLPTGELLWSTDETSTRRPEEVRASISGSSLFDGGFHHVAATWGRGEAAIYVDGQELVRVPSQGGTLNAAASTPLRIGSKGGLGDPFRLAGGIDEVTIHSAALTSEQIAAIHGAGALGKCGGWTTPVGRSVLRAADPLPNDRFGEAVDADGPDVVIGAPAHDQGGTDSGAVYVFRAGSSDWTQQQKLTAADATASDQFGAAVAIDGDTLVVGAPFDAGAGQNTGSAYVFTRSGASWTQQAKLVAADASANDSFGWSVEIDGATIIVGAIGDNTGSAYVFTRSGTTWSQQAKLTASDGLPIDLFGTSVAIDGETAVVGADRRDELGESSGAAYVFVRTGTTWAQQAKLLAGNGAAQDVFGGAVSISGDTVLVGASGTDQGGSNTGSVYFFERAAGTWTQSSQLQAASPVAFEQFGYDVSLLGNVAAVGAFGDTGPGTAHVLVKVNGAWSTSATLQSTDPQNGDRFGRAVSITNGVVAIGATGDAVGGVNAGAVHIFTP